MGKETHDLQNWDPSTALCRRVILMLVLIKLRSVRICRNHLSSKFQLGMNGMLRGQVVPPTDCAHPFQLE